MFSIFNLDPLDPRVKRIEAKIDRLMQHAGLDPFEVEPIPQVSEEVSDNIRTLLRDNQKIPAIKAYREATGASLKDAKSFIDSL